MQNHADPKISLVQRSAASLLADLRCGALSAVDLTTACLARIEQMEPFVRAWAYLDGEYALEQAHAADLRLAKGEPTGALHGLPIGIKDIIDTVNMPTEYNSPLYRNRRPTRDATLVARLRAAGAVIFGKTVTSEFAVSTAGPTRNPRDRSRTPGGSSSGSAAVIAADMVPLALATQTNGSTIRPASFCGIVGYKPGLGVLPRTGILKHATMLDQPGLMAADMAGVALLANAIMGPDPADEMSHCGPWTPLDPAVGIAAPPRFAFVRGSGWAMADKTAQEAIEAFVGSMGDLVDTVVLPPVFDQAVSVHAIIMNAGIANACREDYAHSKDALGGGLREIVETGLGIAAVDLVDAFCRRDELRAAYRDRFAGYDAILTPSTLGIAPLREEGTGNPIMSTLWTLLGAPAITLPLLTGDHGMPLGVQLVGRLENDRALIRAATWLESQALNYIHQS